MQYFNENKVILFIWVKQSKLVFFVGLQTYKRLHKTDSENWKELYAMFYQFNLAVSILR